MTKQRGKIWKYEKIVVYLQSIWKRYAKLWRQSGQVSWMICREVWTVGTMQGISPETENGRRCARSRSWARRPRKWKQVCRMWRSLARWLRHARRFYMIRSAGRHGKPNMTRLCGKHGNTGSLFKGGCAIMCGMRWAGWLRGAKKSLSFQDMIIVALWWCRVKHIFGIYWAYIQHILE